MKKLVLFTLIFIGFVSTTTALKDPTKENEDFSWLIKEVEELYEEEIVVEEVIAMIYVFDAEGNEIISLEESAFEQLSVASKRTINKSELLFQTATDKVYMLSK